MSPTIERSVNNALPQSNELLGKPFLCLFALPRQSNCGQGPRVPFALLQVNEMLGKPLFDCSKALQRWKEGPPDSSCDWNRNDSKISLVVVTQLAVFRVGGRVSRSAPGGSENLVVNTEKLSLKSTSRCWLLCLCYFSLSCSSTYLRKYALAACRK